MKNIIFLTILFLFTADIISQQIYRQVNFDTVKTQRFDMGRMWTFEDAPLDYFEKTYNFRPDQEWLDNVRKGALKFANWCSASFVSEDGLVMTNHHCARENIPTVQKQGENFLRDGFLAKSLEEERRMPDIFVSQLVHIEDVTKKIQDYMAKGKNESEKIQLKNTMINELVNNAQSKYPELKFEVTTLYNGGKYSLYGYMIYGDVRLVFAPDLRTAKLGGDYDNFTYPRYGLDCTFFRVYDKNGNPLKTKHYFKWNINGPKPGEPIFVVGNPGRTNRLNTISQIIFARDVQYPILVNLFKELYQVYYKKVMDNNTQNFELIARLYSIGNGLKVYEGTYRGLSDDYLIARKNSFEKEFKSKVLSDENLKTKYSHIWGDIEKSREEAKKFTNELFAYNINPRFSSEYFLIARDIVRIAEKTKIPNEEREDKYKTENLKNTLTELVSRPFDKEIHSEILMANINHILRLLPSSSEEVKILTNGKSWNEALNFVLESIKILNVEYIYSQLSQGYDEFVKIDDPLIQYILKTQLKLADILAKNSELNAKESVLNQELGKAAYEIYGNTIPPDATFTLRIADGVMQGYDYNGTIAPTKTTFYGVLDRYHSFDKQFPFNLPPIWEDLPKEFNLSTPLNFISTNDIIGGNSGSPVINTNAEIVGLAFDGNLESLPSNFIFTTEANRTINVHSAGMLEAIKNLYKLNRLADELINGKISN